MYIRRPCGCRCVQYSILGGKAQGVRAIFLRQWIFSFLVGQGRVIPHPVGVCPLRSRLTLPPLYPAGGLPSLPPATSAFRLLCCPHPPAPLPLRGRGRPRLFHARGFAPCIPCTEPPAARTVPVVLVPGGIPCREPFPVGFAANYGFSHGNARGEAPCIRKLKVSPFPPGRGLGGWGQQSKLKARAAGDKEGKPPLRTPQRQGQPATSRASPRIGYSNGRSSRQRKNTPPHPKRNPFHS